MRTCIKLINNTVSYSKTFQQSLDPSLQFWKNSAQQIKWHTFPKTMLKHEQQHFYRWFPDGELNITEQCLDQNVIERPNQIAYYIESPITNQKSTITYAELHKRVSQFAGSLKSNFNIKAGDPVIIYRSDSHISIYDLKSQSTHKILQKQFQNFGIRYHYDPQIQNHFLLIFELQDIQF